MTIPLYTGSVYWRVTSCGQQGGWCLRIDDTTSKIPERSSVSTSMSVVRDFALIKAFVVAGRWLWRADHLTLKFDLPNAGLASTTDII
jgi:hypothetical protein